MSTASKPARIETSTNPKMELDRFTKLERDGGRPTGREIGAGKACDDPSQIAAAIVDGLNCGIEDLEVVVQNRAYFQGPLTATSLGNLFTAKVNPFTIGTAQGAVDQAQINLDDGELDCNVLITHVGFRMVPPKELMLVEGGVLGPLPAAGQNGIVVPDAWLASDAETADAFGTLGLAAGQTLTKAYLDIGEWACDFFYDFARAYEWIWKIGNNILMQAPLTKIASIRASAQPGTSGRSRKPFDVYVQAANAYLRANGGTGIFLPRNATQAGTATSNGAVRSNLQPYSYYEEEVTFGGPGVQELCQNPTVYELCTAQLFPRGVKLGHYFNLIDSFAQARANQEASINNVPGAPGAIPNSTSLDTALTTGFIGSGVLPVFQSLTSDSPPVQGVQRVPLGTMRVKIGDFYLVAELMGHRVSQTLVQKAIANETAVCDQVSAMTFGKRSLAMMAGK
ncbi:MAG: hypothetical protein KGI71_04775 [Patescibacteria group bacterium]|nr:hypothetical protein [Patescibacteria group bacterium]